MNNKIFGIYILSNRNKTLYTGVTNNLPRRIWEHKHGKGSIFTKKYKLNELVYYEYCDSPIQSIVREKQIKKMLRKEKIKIIEQKNKIWADLTQELFDACGFIPE